MEKHTSMYYAGYRYYVFVCSGVIQYFETVEEAQEYVELTGGQIGEVW